MLRVSIGGKRSSIIHLLEKDRGSVAAPRRAFQGAAKGGMAHIVTRTISRNLSGFGQAVSALRLLFLSITEYAETLAVPVPFRDIHDNVLSAFPSPVLRASVILPSSLFLIAANLSR